MFLAVCYIFYFTAATISPLQRRLLSQAGHGSGYAPAFAFRASIVVACLGLTLPFFEVAELKGETWTLLLLALTSGVFGAVSVSSQYWAQKHVEAGVTALAGNVYSPVVIILATLLLGEGLTPKQIVGTTLLFVALIAVSKDHHLGRLRFDKYLLAMIWSGAALGICLTAERALINTTGFVTGTLLSWWAQVGGLGLAALCFGTQTTFTLKDTLLTGILRFLQLLSWVLLVYAAGNMSIVSAVTTFKVVLIFILAAIFLKERGNFALKITGSLIAAVGLLLMK